MKRNSLTLIVSGALATTLGLTACGQAGQGDSEGGDAAGGDGGATTVTMWTHSAGNPAELEVYERIISDFNASQDEYEVVQEAFPQGAYNDAVVAAAAAGDLPCLIDMDGPIVPNWAWAGYLQPLGLSTEITDSLLHSAVGSTRARSTAPGTGTPPCPSSPASPCSRPMTSASPPCRSRGRSRSSPPHWRH